MSMRWMQCYLILLALLQTAAGSTNEVPQFAAPHFSAIASALEDGFFEMAERNARKALEQADDEEKHKLHLLLVHALWGQERYVEALEIANGTQDHPLRNYWLARTLHALGRHEEALQALKGDQTQGYHAAERLRLKAYLLHQTGQLDEAGKAYLLFKRYFAKHPEQMENQLDLARLMAARGRFQEAVAFYDEIIGWNHAKGAQQAQLEKARLLYTKGGKHVQAAREMLKGLAASEQHPWAFRVDACVSLATLEEQSGEIDAAAAALQSAVELSPTVRRRAMLMLELVRLHLREDRPAAALQWVEACQAEAPDKQMVVELQLEKAKGLLQAERFEEAAFAFQAFMDVAEAGNGIAEACFGRGVALWELGRDVEAGRWFQKTARLAGGDELRADALFKAGDAFARSELIEEAEQCYRSFLADFPYHVNVAHARYQLALVLAKAGHPADALELLAMIESEHPESRFAEQAAIRTASIMTAEHQWGKALEKYTSIASTSTDTATQALSRHQRGVMLYRLGRYAEAQSAFKQVMAEHGQSTHAPQAMYMRGFCLYMLGRTEEALASCRAFIEAHIDSEWAPEVIFWLAERAYNEGRYAEAETLFLRVSADYPKQRLASRALYQAGRAAMEQSNFTLAIKHFSELARSYPASPVLPEVRFSQGDALTELGEFARAVLAFEEVVKNHPQSELVDAALGRIGDCQFSLAPQHPDRYEAARTAYQTVLDRGSSTVALKLQSEYKIGRCEEKLGRPEKALDRYMNVVYAFINRHAPHDGCNVMWFTRAAFGAATLLEQQQEWAHAAAVYARVVGSGVPAGAEAQRRGERIRQEHGGAFQETKKAEHG